MPATKKSNKTTMESFQLVVDGVPYFVRAIPFDFNDEKRFMVSYNESPDYIFTWDSSLKRITAIDDESGIIPDSLEQAIAAKLQAMVV